MSSAQINIFSQVSFLEKVLFTKHLSVMIRAGIPLLEALETLIEGTKSPVFVKVLKSMTAQIANGQSLTKAMESHPKVFDDFYRSLIQAGEESGALEENLEFLAKQLRKSYILKKKIQGAMLYPGLVFSATFIIGGFVSFYILPKLADFFSAFEVELPIATRVLLFIATTLKNYGLLILITLLILIILVLLLLRLSKIKYVFHRSLLHLPLVGQVLLDEQLARISRNLAVMLKSGVPIVRSLEIVTATLSNLKFQKDLEKITQTVKEGKSIGDALYQQNYWEFPPLTAKMIAVGEKTGQLENVLFYLANFYEEEIDDSVKNLNTVLEPILLIVIGLVVGFVALAIISPIYELTGSISK